MRTAALILANVLLLIPAATAAQESAARVEPSPFGPVAPPPEPGVTRPMLAAPLPRPDGPRARIAARNRPPDASAQRRGVRLELWVPRGPIRTGEFIPTTMRVTNLSGDTISHASGIGCGDSPLHASFDVTGLFGPGETRRRTVQRLVNQFFKATRMDRVRMSPNGPPATGCLGDVGTWQNVDPGWSVTEQVAVRAVYPWRDQPLPSGETTVTAAFRFFREPDLGGKPVDLVLDAPVAVKGQKVSYPSPQQLADALLAEPVLLDWAKTRWQNAAIYLNPTILFDSRAFEGGQAPEDVLGFDLQAAGRTSEWFSDIAIDPWTAEVLRVD